MKDLNNEDGTCVGKGTVTLEDRDGEPELFSLVLLQEALSRYQEEYGCGKVHVSLLKGNNKTTGEVRQLLHLTDEEESGEGIFVAPRKE